MPILLGIQGLETSQWTLISMCVDVKGIGILYHARTKAKISFGPQTSLRSHLTASNSKKLPGGGCPHPPSFTYMLTYTLGYKYR